MKYAPVLIPTLCRYTHFVRLIESLKKNTWAKYTEIYVGVDYPPSEKYEGGYRKIKEYLKGDFSVFAAFHVFYRECNYGSFKNMTALRLEVFKRFDRFIRTDDDAEFSPNFLEFMDRCLMKYEDDPDVFSVSGYSYPMNWSVSPKSTVFKENFICPMWGTGFWKDKYVFVNEQINHGVLYDKAPQIVKAKLYDKMLKSSRMEFVNLCLSDEFYSSLASVMSDVAVRIYMVANDQYVICPKISKTRNWGFDGTGEYCKGATDVNNSKVNARNYLYHLQEIDNNEHFELVEDDLQQVDENRRLLDEFEAVSQKRILLTNIKLLLYRILGSACYRKIIKMKRH